MPIHLINRRNLFGGAIGGLAAMTTVYSAIADAQVAGGTQMAWLSDPHIASLAVKRHGGISMANQFEQTIREVLRGTDADAAVVINGDLAFLRGTAGDYQTFGRLIQPLVQSRDVYLALGNHDDRDACFASLNRFRRSREVDGKHATKVSTPHYDLFILDTLQRVNNVTGEAGKRQIDWLDEQLAADPQRPAVVMGHHNLQDARVPNQTVNGLEDTAAIVELMDRHTHAIAYVCGHQHRWFNMERTAGWKEVRLPTTAYVFQSEQSPGWVDVRSTADELTIELHTLNPVHAGNGDTVTIAMRRPEPDETFDRSKRTNRLNTGK